MVTLIAGMCIGVAFFGLNYFLLDTFTGRKASERKLFQKRVDQLLPRASLAVNIEKINKYSDIKALNKLLREQEFSQSMKRLMEMAGWKISLGAYILITLFPAILATLFLTSKGMPFAIALLLSVAVFIVMAFMVLKFRAAKYIDKFTNQFPNALHVMRGALSAGIGLGNTFERVSIDCTYPVNREFAYLAEQMKLGQTFVETLLKLQKRIPSSDVRTFCIAVMVQQETGGNLTELIKNLEETIIARILLRRELKALTAQTRFSGYVVALLPVVISFIIKLTNPEYYSLLTATETGKIILMMAVGLEVVGFICVSYISNIKIVA
jgi:tight adherence protein B